MSVTNPPLRLLGIFLISQPFVHIPDTKRENHLQPTSHWLIHVQSCEQAESKRDTRWRFSSTQFIRKSLLFSRPLPQQLQLPQETILLFLDVPRHIHHVSTVKQTKDESGDILYFSSFTSTNPKKKNNYYM